MKDAFYFPHDYDARTDECIINLLRECQWAGYGIYWAIIEKMHQAGGELELNCESIAFDLRTDKELIEKIIKNFKLFQIKGQKFTSERVKNNIANRILKSEKARLSARSRWGYDKPLEDANALPAQSERNARKERKGKERICSVAQPSADAPLPPTRSAKKQFLKPAVAEIESYCRERENSIDPQYFFDKMEAGGWVYGKHKTQVMDWKAVIRTWEKYASPAAGDGDMSNYRKLIA